MGRGALFVISAPSGAGKSSLIKALREEMPVSFSISHTTRPPRPGEIDGVHYHFVTKEVFEKMVENSEFAEWAEVHGNLYGTSFRALDEAMEKGNDVILDIDVQGALNLREKTDLKPVLVFIMPPSLAELEKRLTLRGDVDDEVIRRRLDNARGETAQAGKYDYIIVNDNFDKAVQDLGAVILAGKPGNKGSTKMRPDLFGSN
ncbi:guanylate kinase [bacterium]|nr:MAG: guanylate kinase [bacterium]